MAKWRLYAAREFPRVVLELGLPCAIARHAHDICPAHHEPIGATTHLCKSCFDQAWAEVGRRYSLASQGAGRKENR